MDEKFLYIFSLLVSLLPGPPFLSLSFFHRADEPNQLPVAIVARHRMGSLFSTLFSSIFPRRVWKTLFYSIFSVCWHLFYVAMNLEFPINFLTFIRLTLELLLCSVFPLNERAKICFSYKTSFVAYDEWPAALSTPNGNSKKTKRAEDRRERGELTRKCGKQKIKSVRIVCVFA